MDKETEKGLEVPKDLAQALLRLAYFDAEEAILSVDQKGRIATASQGACELLGYRQHELVGTAFDALLAPARRDSCLALVASLEPGGRARNVDTKLLHKDGLELAVRANLYRPLDAAATVLWIRSEAAKAGEWRLDDDALRDVVTRLQQLASVGQLSAALAHQIRTPLHVIQSTVEFIQDELPAGSPHQDSLRVVDRNVDRIAALTEALRGFVLQRKHSVFPGELNKVVDQACLFIEMLCKKRGIKLKKSLGTVGLVRLDPDYLLGALYNLMANAVEAMPEGGVLTVVTAGHENEVTLSIADTGKGMAPAVLEQIGRPFFTTKATGTGLGVLVAKKILEQHAATLKIESKHEVGTRVMISFPAA